MGKDGGGKPALGHRRACFHLTGEVRQGRRDVKVVSKARRLSSPPLASALASRCLLEEIDGGRPRGNSGRWAEDPLPDRLCTRRLSSQPLVDGEREYIPLQFHHR